MSKKEVIIDHKWDVFLKKELEQPYFEKILLTISKERDEGIIIYASDDKIFTAFNLTPPSSIKVVILGQDPYHQPGEAMGLAFSVPKGVRIPPSLRNIFKEMNQDIGYTIPNHGDLTEWANNGILLLNSILTVQHNLPKSHKKIGWEKFTDAVVKLISESYEGVVFMLWGNDAKKKIALIDEKKHLILTAAHPSPLARGAFFGSQNFSQCKKYINKQNVDLF